jgi:hypothetical protein
MRIQSKKPIENNDEIKHNYLIVYESGDFSWRGIIAVW